MRILVGTFVTLVIPLKDAAGVQYTGVLAADYQVVDPSEAIIVPRTTAVGFTVGALNASVTVEGSHNLLPNDSLTFLSAREVQVLLTLADGSAAQVNAVYEISSDIPTNPLSTMLNSFQTVSMAELTASSMAGLLNWSTASANDKVVAMTDAFRRIRTKSFTNINVNDQSRLDFYGPSLQVYNTGRFIGGVSSLDIITKEQFLSFPEQFKLALRTAQVSEADFILGPDPVTAMRALGVISHTAGESTTRFREAAQWRGPLCPRTMRYLARYLNQTIRVGR